MELFAGGAALSFELEAPSALLNDTNTALINFYRSTAMGYIPPIYDYMTNEHYLRIRDEFNRVKRLPQGMLPRGDGELFYVLNKFAFNGLYRENAAGGFNVPWNKKTRVAYANWHEAYMLMGAGHWMFSDLSYELVKLAPGDLVFADPPYADVFSAYQAGGFGWGEQERLAAYLAKLTHPVVTTNIGTPAVLDMYRDLGFTVETISAPRKIACNGDREPVWEMVATRNLQG